MLVSLICLANVLSYAILMAAGDIFPLHKLIGKLTQILLVLSIFPLRKFLKLSWADLGFAPKKPFFKQMGLGFCAGFLTLLPVFGILYWLDVQVWNAEKIWSMGKVLSKISLALFFALLISYLEEPIFRGILFSGLRKKMAVFIAIIVSASYYAALHFLDNHSEIAYSDLQLTSGFLLLKGALFNLVHPPEMASFWGLFMVGIFLATIRTKIPQSLGICIGLHASWVWQIKLSKLFLTPDFNSPYAFLVSHYDGLVGYFVAGWLFLATLIFLFYRPFYARNNG